MSIEIEELRGWVNSRKGKWPEIVKATGYPYDSLQKFADGRVLEPRLGKLLKLNDYKNKIEKL